VLDRIHRTSLRLKARFFPEGRHRRRASLPRRCAPVTLRPPAAGPTDTETLSLDCASPPHSRPLLGEDNALVRPYVLARETLVRRGVPAASSSGPSDTWSVFQGAH
jgi:hypothetical protein